jgi:hypothetical protein
MSYKEAFGQDDKVLKHNGFDHVFIAKPEDAKVCLVFVVVGLCYAVHVATVILTLPSLPALLPYTFTVCHCRPRIANH